ncbi:MAG TPA: hypothetical protein VFJ17_06110 [Mycobacteriales bacterium]|nr:hypothetical protein [Mycobacteriales bacterium]
MTPDWVTISSLATAAGTLVLAVATFGSVRSANRAARVAEESLLAGIRPLLISSRPEDPTLKVGFGDDHYVMSPGGGGTAEPTDAAIYLTMSIRNAGSGIAVLHGWRIEADPTTMGAPDHPPVDEFRRLTRDLYIPAGDIGFWQGAIRDPADPHWQPLRQMIESRQRIVIDLLYGDHQGGQRLISRFSLLPRSDAGWMTSVSRHWNVDRQNPR